MSATGFTANVLARAKTPAGVTAPQYLVYKDKPRSEWPVDWHDDKQFQSARGKRSLKGRSLSHKGSKAVTRQEMVAAAERDLDAAEADRGCG